MDPKGSIKPTDVLTVRECGNQLVESFRQLAIKVNMQKRGRVGSGLAAVLWETLSALHPAACCCCRACC